MDKLQMAVELYETYYRAWESFKEENPELIGEALYLLGAVLNDSYVSLPPNHPLLKFIEEYFPDEHLIHEYIVIE